MSDKNLDKRRCHRINLKIPATFKIKGTTDDLAKVTMLNVSAIGLAISSKTKIDLGEKVVVHLKLPDEQEVSFSAEVMWVKEKVVYEVSSYKVGLKISDRLGPDERKFIHFYASQLLEMLK